jgi:hypothetical protein
MERTTAMPRMQGNPGGAGGERRKMRQATKQEVQNEILMALVDIETHTMEEMELFRTVKENLRKKGLRM